MTIVLQQQQDDFSRTSIMVKQNSRARNELKLETYTIYGMLIRISAIFWQKVGFLLTLISSVRSMTICKICKHLLSATGAINNGEPLQQ